MQKGNKSGGKNSNTKKKVLHEILVSYLSFSNEKNSTWLSERSVLTPVTEYVTRWMKWHTFEKQQSKSRNTANPLRLKKQTNHKYSVLSAHCSSPLKKIIYMYIYIYINITTLEVSSCSSSWTKLFRDSDKAFLSVCTASWHNITPS